MPRQRLRPRAGWVLKDARSLRLCSGSFLRIADLAVERSKDAQAFPAENDRFSQSEAGPAQMR